jgi:hypothetical protein
METRIPYGYPHRPGAAYTAFLSPPPWLAEASREAARGLAVPFLSSTDICTDAACLHFIRDSLDPFSITP